METEAFVHVAPNGTEATDEWRLSVAYRGTFAQIRIHGSLSRQGTTHARLAFELQRLADALVAIAAEPSTVRWERPGASGSLRDEDRKPPKRDDANGDGRLVKRNG